MLLTLASGVGRVDELEHPLWAWPTGRVTSATAAVQEAVRRSTPHLLPSHWEAQPVSLMRLKVTCLLPFLGPGVYPRKPHGSCLEEGR